MTRNRKAHLSPIKDESGRTVLVVYHNGQLTFRHRRSRRPLAQVQVQAVFTSATKPLLAMMGNSAEK